MTRHTNKCIHAYIADDRGDKYHICNSFFHLFYLDIKHSVVQVCEFVTRITLSSFFTEARKHAFTSVMPLTYNSTPNLMFAVADNVPLGLSRVKSPRRNGALVCMFSLVRSAMGHRGNCRDDGLL